MIIKGKGRTNAKQLGEYLDDLSNYLKAAKNERVEVLEFRGSAFPDDLGKSLRAWEAEAMGGRCKKPIWHAQLRTRANEHLTREQQLLAVDVLERHLKLVGQPRAIVIHENEDGHEHIHVAWSRIDRATGKTKRDSFTYKQNVAAAREIEERLGLEPVASPDFEKKGDRKQRREESKKAANYSDHAKARRSKLDPKERGKTITALWPQTDSGKAFRAALQEAGYILANGDSRDFVVVDQAGDIHSVARQIKIKGINAEQVRQRFADIDPASVPHAKHVSLDMWRAWKERQAENEPTLPKKPKKAQNDAAVPVEAVTRKEKDEDEPASRSLDPVDILAGLTRGQSTFTVSDLHREIVKRLEKRGDDVAAETVRDLKREVATHEQFVQLGKDRVGRRRYTSRDMLDTELAMANHAAYLAAMKRHGVPEKVKGKQPKAADLSDEQRKALQHITTDSALALVIGYAGTGKSHMLGAAKEEWEAAGLRVRGITLSGIAAQSLQDGSGIESRTIKSWFYQMQKLPELQERLAGMDEAMARITGDSYSARQTMARRRTERDEFAARLDGMGLTERDVVVIDEAGMVGSRDINQILELARVAKAKVVMVGDAEQLQAIDAGGAFRALTDRHGAVKISSVRRQKDDWAKQATKDFGDGFTADALGAYNQRGHMHQIEADDDRRAQMVTHWTASRRANLNESHIMLAFTRDDVANLNVTARAAYKDEGRLGLDHTVKTEDGRKEFAQGDRMYFLENSTQLKVKNGSLGTIDKIEPNSIAESHRITVKLDTGKTVEFETADYGNFSHGYAATVHKSQGVTAKRSFVLASKYMDRHAAYVAMSRHVERADMYYSKSEFADYEHLVTTLSRDRRKDTTLDYHIRAETKAEMSKFDKVAAKIIGTVTKEDKIRKAREEMLEALRLQRDPAARATKQQEKVEEKEARRLRDILAGVVRRKRPEVDSGPSV